MTPKLLRICLDPPTLASARAGRFNFLNQVKMAVEHAGWQVEWAPETCKGSDRAFRMFHMKHPKDGRSLMFRRAYHYPFWHIETEEKRWRWPVAHARFDPETTDPAEASDFFIRLRNRVLPGPDPRHDGPILIALQGMLHKARSFQTMSPLDMVRSIARTGEACVATLHPHEDYSPRELTQLAHIAEHHPNLTIGGDTNMLLRNCRFVVSENSAVAFNGYLLEKPAILFAQIDFHHIALNVADIGVDRALALAPHHRPDFAGYVRWFLRDQAIDAMAANAQSRIRAAMRRGGWPI